MEQELNVPGPGKGARNRVWHWEDLQSWSETVMRLLAPEVTQDVIQRFRRKRPREIFSDDQSWLNDLIEKSSGDYVDITSLLGLRLYDAFDSLRAYHGARPEGVEQYLEHGLVPLDPAAAGRRAHAIFSTPAHGGFTAQEIDSAIAKVGVATREGRVYFEADRRNLMDYCAHYMLYGSEYITGVAAALSTWPPDVRQVLKKIGRPTLFICDVPLSLIHQDTLEEFAGMAITAIFQRIRHPTDPHPPIAHGAGFSIQDRLPPTCIVRYEQPTELFDPLLHRIVRC